MTHNQTQNQNQLLSVMETIRVHIIFKHSAHTTAHGGVSERDALHKSLVITQQQQQQWHAAT